jgi:hypothetical protein
MHPTASLQNPKYWYCYNDSNSQHIRIILCKFPGMFNNICLLLLQPNSYMTAIIMFKLITYSAVLILRFYVSSKPMSCSQDHVYFGCKIQLQCAALCGRVSVRRYCTSFSRLLCVFSLPLRDFSSYLTYPKN